MDFNMTIQEKAIKELFFLNENQSKEIVESM